MANNNEAFELSDEQLEMVSGGSSAPLFTNVVEINPQIAVVVAPTSNNIVNVGGDLKALQGGATLKNLGLLSSLSAKF